MTNLQEHRCMFCLIRTKQCSFLEHKTAAYKYYHSHTVYSYYIVWDCESAQCSDVVFASRSGYFLIAFESLHDTVRCKGTCL